MRIGILETGCPPPALAAAHGRYDAMFARLLGSTYSYTSFDVQKQAYPAVIGDCDAYLITGSAAGVDDGDDWIASLKDFLRDVAGSAPLIGICFGHQILAETFGGRVRRRGWSIGMHEYALQHWPAWMDGAASFRIPASHRDQIVDAPDGALSLAGNDFTRFAALLYPEQRALSFQGHPEFTRAYAAALLGTRRGDAHSSAEADAAIASLGGAHDGARVANWMRSFLEETAK